MSSTPASGVHLLRSVIGHRLRGIRRWVLDLANANDEFGHGITELRFDHQTLTFKPGPNEDYIIIEIGAVDPNSMDQSYFTEVDLYERTAWAPPSGKLQSVDLFSDGLQDVGILFRFESGETLLIGLIDTDLVLDRDERAFEQDPEVVPVLRETIS